MVNCNISYLGAVFLQYRSTPFLQYNTASHLTFTSILWLLNISWKLMNSFEKINHCWTFLNDNNFIVRLQPLSNHCCMHQWHYQRFAYQSLSGHLLEIFEKFALFNASSYWIWCHNQILGPFTVQVLSKC